MSNFERLRKIVTNLNEESLSRVWQSATDPKLLFGIVTAYRSPEEGRTIEEQDTLNRKNQAQLKKDIREAGLGYFELEGHWIENQGEPEEIDVTEPSLFVSISKDTEGNREKRLRTVLLNALKKYNQDAVIAKLSDGDIKLIFKDGSEEPIGKFSPGKIAQAYSRIRGGRTFVFESVRPSTFIGATIRKRAK